MWVNYLVTKVEEERRDVLENENGTENIAVFDDHPCMEKAYGSCSLRDLSLFAAVEERTIVTENGFGLKGKNDRNLQGSMNVKGRFVVVVPFQSLFSRPCQNPRVSSS